MKVSETGRFNLDQKIKANEVAQNVENIDPECKTNFAGSTETFCLSASNDATSKEDQKFSENQDLSQEKSQKISKGTK